jgi:hypothetical protein
VREARERRPAAAGGGGGVGAEERGARFLGVRDAGVLFEEEGGAVDRAREERGRRGVVEVPGGGGRLVGVVGEHVR